MEQIPEPTYDEGKTYAVAGGLLNKIFRYLRARTPLAGPNILLRDTAAGFIIEASGSGDGGAPAGAFWRVYQSEGDWFLQGGQVAGAQDSSEAVPDITLGTVGTEPADGTIHWLEITGSGIVSGGRLQPGFEVTEVDDGGGSTLPPNTSPTAASASAKKYHLRLGVWQGDVFQPDAGGHVAIGYCGNQYRITR
jgi:hypothetical protein